MNLINYDNIMIQQRIYNYFERNPQLRVLFLFDKMGVYEGELLNAQWADGYQFHAFDGKWFNLKLKLNHEWKEEKVVLLFPWELRPDSEAKMLAFPLLDVYAANMEFKDESYAEFMQRYGLGQDVAMFVKNHIDELSSSKITTMLSGYLNAESFSTDLGVRAIVSSYLGDKKLLEWDGIIVKMMILDLKSEAKRQLDFYVKLQKHRELNKAVNEKLLAVFGVTYNPNSHEKMGDVAQRLKYNAITQSLAVSPEDNYKSLKLSGRFVLDQINRIYDKGMQDNLLSSKFKAALSELAESIKESELIRVYGANAPFYYLTESLSLPIIADALVNGVATDPIDVLDRMRSLSLHLGPDSDQLNFVHFVEAVAMFYDSVSHVESYKLDTAAEYVQLYKDVIVKIDRNYRQAIEEYYKLTFADDTVSHQVSSSKRLMDEKYAQVCNMINYEWIECVRDTGSNFANTGLLRQDEFYSTYFDPAKRLVVIISDALRYEVADELIEQLGKEKHAASLTPMLALLPTDTKFCKPALLPHSELSLSGGGMLVDNKELSSTKSRSEQLQKYRQDSVCVNFSEVSSQIQSHRELFKKQLVYVFHDRIDSNGHGQSAEDVVANCRKAIDELTKFVHSLHMTLNCYNVIITSDHGFLFNDMIFEDKDKISIKEETIISSSRYYLTESDDAVMGISKFPLNAVTPIKAPASVIYATPTGTNRLAAPGGYGFAHGGASLQEMLVPVIVSNRRETNTKQKVNVTLKTTNLAMVSSQLRFQLVQKEAVSMDMISRRVICCVYEGDTPVTEPLTVTLESTDPQNIAKRTYDVSLRLNRSVSGGLLQLRVYDDMDDKNPLIKETVKNNTIIEQDF